MLTALQTCAGGYGLVVSTSASIMVSATQGCKSQWSSAQAQHQAAGAAATQAYANPDMPA